MKKRVIHVIHSLSRGGSENALLRAIQKINGEHLFITLYSKGEMYQEYTENSIKVININQKNIFDRNAIDKTKTIIADFKPNLIITNLLHADIFGRLVLKKVTNTPIIPYLQTTYNFRRYLPARLFEGLTKYLVKEYLANSQSVKKYYVERYNIDSKKIYVVPNGIEISNYDSSKANTKLIRTLNLRNRTVITCVANLLPNKGHRYLLEAFEKIFIKYPDVKLLICGDGVERNNLINQIKNYRSKSNIIFLGKRSDVPSILRISDIFVLPTLFEGMSNAIMEAMASRLPVITTDIEENRELIEHKKSGLLCPIKNSSSIAYWIDELVNDKNLRSSLGNNAHAVIEKNYRIDRVAKMWETYYERF